MKKKINKKLKVFSIIYIIHFNIKQIFLNNKNKKMISNSKFTIII